MLTKVIIVAVVVVDELVQVDFVDYLAFVLHHQYFLD